MSVYSEMTITQLLEERNKLDAQIYGLCGSTPSGKSEKTKAEKVKRKSGPTAWSDWTKKVLAENKEAVKAFTEAAEKKLGAHLQWIKANMGKESPEWKAYQAEWQATHPKEAKEVSDEGSEVSAPSKSSGRRGAKKLDEMTVEERAKHDATIAERRAKKEAEKAAGEAAGKAESAAAPVSSASSVVSTEKKKSSYVPVSQMNAEQKAKYEANKEKAKAAKAAKSAPKAEAVAAPAAEVKPVAAPKPKPVPAAVAEVKAVAAPKPKAAAPKATPKPVAEPVAEAAPEAEGEMSLIPFELDGESYFRLGSKSADGTIEWEGDLWLNKGGVRGSYVGVLLDDGSFDTDAEEPMFE